MRFLVWQEKRPFMLNSCLVFQKVIQVVFIMNGHVAQGLLHGLEPVSI